MAARLSPRLRVLKTLDRNPHRFLTIRRFTMALTLGILYAVPLLGLARFDLWDGRHMAAGSRTNFVYGFGAVFLAVVGFYLVTFLINAVAGRVFCGFGCPVGEVARLGDAAEIAARTGEGRLAAGARSALFAVALAGAGFLWFTDPRVFVEGSSRAIATAAAGLAGGTVVLLLHGRYVRWKFCQRYCPIGVYYSAVQTNHRMGIHFDEAHGTCKGCDICTQVCPVGLTPRDLTTPLNDVSGIAIDGFPQANHCLTCGDCVRACESVFKHKDDVVIPLSLSRKPDARLPREALPQPLGKPREDRGPESESR